MDTCAPTRALLNGTILPEFGYPVLLPESLPSRDHLLTALAGHLTDAPNLLGWARELGDLHASLIPGTVDPGCRQGLDVYAVHAKIIHIEAEINSWALFFVPRRPGARRYTHSLGEVIGHIARTFAQVSWAMRHTDDQQRAHDAWFHLAEVIEGYTDFVDDLAAGRIQLPLGRHGVYPLDTVSST